MTEITVEKLKTNLEKGSRIDRAIGSCSLAILRPAVQNCLGPWARPPPHRKPTFWDMD